MNQIETQSNHGVHGLLPAIVNGHLELGDREADRRIEHQDVLQETEQPPQSRFGCPHQTLDQNPNAGYRGALQHIAQRNTSKTDLPESLLVGQGDPKNIALTLATTSEA